MRDMFIEEIALRMQGDERIFFVSADLGSSALDTLRAKHPSRFVNVGIAEQNLVNVSAGLALEGFKVIAYAIAPFITMRCYEQVRVNLSMLSQFRDINVNLVGVGAGLSYDLSGPSHQALEDLSIMMTLPNIQVFSPSDAITSRAIAAHTVTQTGPKYVRLDGKLLPVIPDDHAISMKPGFRELKKGRDICLISTGYMTHHALEASRLLSHSGIDTGVIDLYAINGFDRESLKSTIRSYKHLVTLEEAFTGKGGMDTCIQSFLKQNRIDTDLVSLGFPHEYRFTVGPRDTRLAETGIDANGIAAHVRSIMQH